MKEKDLHTKQQEELKKNVAFERNERRRDIEKAFHRNDRERRDVANEERIREKLKGKP